MCVCVCVCVCVHAAIGCVVRSSLLRYCYTCIHTHKHTHRHTYVHTNIHITHTYPNPSFPLSRDRSIEAPAAIG